MCVRENWNGHSQRKLLQFSVPLFHRSISSSLAGCCGHHVLPPYLLRQQPDSRFLLLFRWKGVSSELSAIGERKIADRFKRFAHSPERSSSRMEVRGRRWVGRADRCHAL